jgi:hypothetical protein
MNAIFIKKLFFLVLAIIISVTAILLARLTYADPLATIINKKEILTNSNRLNKPRMIFIGGSAVLVGIDGALIEKYLPFYPVNMGVNAGFSIPFMLDLIKSNIKTGDVIVLTPEMCILANYSYKGKENRKWCLAVNKEFTLKNWYKFPAQLSDLAIDIFGLCEWKLVGFIEAVLMRINPFVNGWVLFNRKTNRFGDSNRIFFKSESCKILRETDETFSALKDSSFVNDFNDFASYAKSKGAMLLFVYGPCSKEGYLKNQDKIQKIIAMLHSSAQYPIIGAQEDFVYDYSCFTNSAYHLNAACRSERTMKIIDEIKPYLVKNYKNRDRLICPP